MNFAGRVQAELHRYRLFTTAIRSPHEGYVALQDHVEDLFRLVKSESANKGDVLLELAQIGAISQRTAEDTGLVEAVGGKRSPDPEGLALRRTVEKAVQDYNGANTDVERRDAMSGLYKGLSDFSKAFE